MSFPTDLTLTPPPEQALPARTTKSKLLKGLDCLVEYPDGTAGICQYERMGPAYHSFTFQRGEKKRPLSHLWSLDRIANTPAAIGAKCSELAESAFWRAVEYERRDWFARATIGTGSSRTVDHRTYRMDLRRAKAIGGKYALCVAVGIGLVPYSAIQDTLKEACQAWKDGKQHLVVACCSRLDRNWQLCELNPLTKEGHPKREDSKSGVGA